MLAIKFEAVLIIGAFTDYTDMQGLFTFSHHILLKSFKGTLPLQFHEGENIKRVF